MVVLIQKHNIWGRGGKLLTVVLQLCDSCLQLIQLSFSVYSHRKCKPNTKYLIAFWDVTSDLARILATKISPQIYTIFVNCRKMCLNAKSFNVSISLPKVKRLPCTIAHLLLKRQKTNEVIIWITPLSILALLILVGTQVLWDWKETSHLLPHFQGLGRFRKFTEHRLESISWYSTVNFKPIERTKSYNFSAI